MKTKSQRSKGNRFEYEVRDNLAKVYPNVWRTGEKGFIQQYDIQIDLQDGNFIAVECKRHKGFRWNELKKIFEKLRNSCPEAYDHCLIFKANRQPALVMYMDNSELIIKEFKNLFKTEFEQKK